MATLQADLTTDPAQAREWLGFVGHAVEIRSLGESTIAGVFNDRHEAADIATSLPGNIYATVNRLAAHVDARNCVYEAGRGELVKDRDVVAYRFIVADLDPVRPSGTAATDIEHAAALALADKAAELGESLGFGKAAIVDSGNGAYCVWRCDLPTTDAPLVKRMLDELAKRLDTDVVTVDRSVWNPSRIFRIPGTVNRKGPNTPERPHRLARIISLPEQK